MGVGDLANRRRPAEDGGRGLGDGAVTDLTAHWRKSYQNKYLGSWDLFGEKAGRYLEATVRIDDVRQEEVIGEGGRKTYPILLYCSGKRPLPAPYIVTKTSGKTLEIMFGPSPKAWVGQTITFYVRLDKKVRMGTGAVLVIRNTKGSKDMVEELKARETVDESELDQPAEREPGVD
jgi:hypothetical protein